MRKLRNIAIATSDPLVAGAIYDRMVERIDVASVWEQPDVVLYSDRLPNDDTEFAVLNRTEVLRIQNTGDMAVLLPDIDLSAFIDNENIVNRMPVITSNVLPAITSEMLEGIRENIADNKIPEEDGKKREQFFEAMSLITQWADILIDVSFGNKNDEIIIREKSNKKPEQSLMRRAKDQKRHQNGFIAIHGGMGPTAGNDSFIKLGEDEQGVGLLLASAVTTPYSVDHMMASEDSTVIEDVDGIKSPVNRLLDTRRKLEALKPDVIFMTCNTAHHYHRHMVRDSSARTLNLVQEGIQNIPQNSRILVLATQAAIEKEVFKRILGASGRGDVELIYPDEKNQKLVESAIWDDIVPGHLQRGGEKLKQVIGNCEAMHGNNLYYLFACTEVVLGVGDMVDKSKVIDNAEITRQKALIIAREASQLRRFSKFVVQEKSIKPDDIGQAKSPRQR